MTTLICGSLAYDHVMQFEGRFHEHILSEHLSTLNLCFLVPTLQREFGGCAANIAYGLRALGEQPRIMGALGALDAQPFLERLHTLGLSTQDLQVLPGMHCAQAMIMTDLDHNQITAFHPGAMAHAHLKHVDHATPITLGIIAPDGQQGMYEHAEQFFQAGIPFLFDPGQQLPLFEPSMLHQIIQWADYITVNHYESQLLSRKTGWSIEHIASQVKAMVITHSEAGAMIYQDHQSHTIPAVPVKHAVDPTGCGDAFRAGLIYGITHQLDWLTTGRLANLMGSIKIAHAGPQGYPHTEELIRAHFQENFGYAF